MLVTTHCAVGALAGAAAVSVPAAASWGVVSHFVLDSIPHWGAAAEDTRLRWRVSVFDGIGGLVLLGGLAAGAAVSGSPVLVRAFAGAAAASLPDWDKPYARFVGGELWPTPVNTVHRSIQRESPDVLAREIAVASVAFAATAFWIKRGLTVSRRTR